MNLRSIASSKTFTVILHVMIWVGLFLLPFLDEQPWHATPYFVTRNAFLLILLASFYYLNYYILLPKLFLPNRFLLYYGGIFLMLILVCVINLVFAGIMDMVYDHVRNRPGVWRRLSFPVFPALFMFAISTAIKLTNEWFRNEKEKKEMENEKLTSELAFLKSQVNPHFLFNILNNICSLARKKSDDTENAIIKLSQIMRYMLYDSKDEKVSLEKEVDYLKNYIELQQIRLSGAVSIDFVIDGDPGMKMIEPLLLIPFVENAFKHGISYVGDSKILIRLEVREHTLTFRVENRIARKVGGEIQTDSGIGLKNVLRRLDLLYPDKHDLITEDDGTDYKSFLKLVL